MWSRWSRDRLKASFRCRPFPFKVYKKRKPAAQGNPFLKAPLVGRLKFQFLAVSRFLERKCCRINEISIGPFSELRRSYALRFLQVASFYQNFENLTWICSNFGLKLQIDRSRSSGRVECTDLMSKNILDESFSI